MTDSSTQELDVLLSKYHFFQRVKNQRLELIKKIKHFILDSCLLLTFFIALVSLPFYIF